MSRNRDTQQTATTTIAPEAGGTSPETPATANPETPIAASNEQPPEQPPAKSEEEDLEERLKKKFGDRPVLLRHGGRYGERIGLTFYGQTYHFFSGHGTTVPGPIAAKAIAAGKDIHVDTTKEVKS